jgi:cbb3-type cytochrome oxidase subunit 3
MIEWLSINAGVTGLLFFFTTFLGVCIWAFRPKAKQTIESYKNIPLEEDK